MSLSVIHSDAVESKEPSKLEERVDFDKLLQQLQKHVSTNRIRVCEYFQDFDHLRSGHISVARFRQVIRGGLGMRLVQC